MKKVLITLLILFSILCIFAIEDKIVEILSSNRKYMLTLKGKPGISKTFLNAVELTLSDSTGAALWSKDLRYHGKPAVSNFGECAIPSGVRTKTAIEFFDINGNFIGKFDRKKTVFYMYTNTNSNEQIHTYSFDGKNFCFFTNIEVTEKIQLWFLDNHGIELWKYELDRFNYPVSVEVLQDVVYLKTIKRSFEKKQGRTNKYIQVHNFSEETHLINIQTGERIIE